MGGIGVGQLRPQVTIGTLPDDVLLKIFKSFVDAMGFDGSVSDEWHTLVHVCRRWRYLAFTSPRHLNLQLYYNPSRRSGKDMLEIWPELPICIHVIGGLMKVDRDDCIATLRLNHRVSGIRLEKTSDLARETILSQMRCPFPALTHLLVRLEYSFVNATISAVSRSFLGGSAPSLQVLALVWFPFPALPELPLSSTNLTRLEYDHIPPTGYISPQAMVIGLSALTRLESLSLSFQSCEDLPDMASRILPPHTRTLLPALTNLRFRGVPEYMEDFVAQIDAPLLESMVATFFLREVLEVSQLAKFVHRADKLSSLDQAEVTFKGDRITLNLSQELHMINPKSLMLNLSCPQWALQLSYFARFCASCLPTLSGFECLLIHVPTRYTWEDVIGDPDPQWPELLHPFHAVKDLRLSKYIAPHIAQVLRRLPVEQVSEVLPALEAVFIAGLKPFGPVKEATSEFADARQRSGHPVSIFDWEERDHDILEDVCHLYDYM